MKKYPSKTGPFAYRLAFETSEIDDICLEALSKAGFLPAAPKPIRVEMFVERHFQAEVSFENMPPGYLGYTAFNTDGSIRIVAVSSKLTDGGKSSERRLRTTWAHEAGHCLLHPSLFMGDDGQGKLEMVEATVPKQREFLCRDGDVDPAAQQKKYDGRWWEWQANRAIGGLLMPKPLVSVAVQPFLGAAHTLSNSGRREAEENLSETFDVNPVVARIRLAEMFPDPRGQQSLL